MGSIESIRIDRVTQYAETDVGFLRRLASEYGYAVKVVGDQLIFSSGHTAPVGAGQAVKTAGCGPLSLRDTINQVYKSAR